MLSTIVVIHVALIGTERWSVVNLGAVVDAIAQPIVPANARELTGRCISVYVTLLLLMLLL